MKGRILTREIIAQFKICLQNGEKSENTVEKYLRDVRAFTEFSGGNAITKETVVAYKEHLKNNYAVRSVNSMLASINGLFSFLGWQDLKVKSVKL